MPRMKKRSKYRSRKVTVDGITFDSAKEASRYGQLKLLQDYGKIADLELQPKYDFVANGVKICSYRADFRYVEDGRSVVEDVKGFKTPEYRIKKKLMKAFFDIDIHET